MVQLEPNTTLTLKHLAPSGATFTDEVTAALGYSLPLKRAEAGVDSLALWGRLRARNGKDYLVAEGLSAGAFKNGAAHFASAWFVSQDGVKWADLPPVDSATAERANRLRGALSGDPAAITAVEEDDPNAPAAPAADAEGGDGEGPKKLTFEIRELQRVRVMVEAIAAATSIVPVGAYTRDAADAVVPAPLWPGASHADKLEAFQHRAAATTGATLAGDVRGTWTVQRDAFRGLTVLRSLLFPGFAFYYSGRDAAWGGLYVGDGLSNRDLVFML